VFARINGNSQNPAPELINTDVAAKLLLRQRRTLCVWATSGSGPLTPIRIHGRLGWPIVAIQKLIRSEPRRLLLDSDVQSKADSISAPTKRQSHRSQRAACAIVRKAALLSNHELLSGRQFLRASSESCQREQLYLFFWIDRYNKSSQEKNS
jgi:hypothetical protein